MDQMDLNLLTGIISSYFKSLYRFSHIQLNNYKPFSHFSINILIFKDQTVLGSGVGEDDIQWEKNTHETPRKLAKTKFEINEKKKLM